MDFRYDVMQKIELLNAQNRLKIDSRLKFGQAKLFYHNAAWNENTSMLKKIGNDLPVPSSQC